LLVLSPVRKLALLSPSRQKLTLSTGWSHPRAKGEERLGENIDNVRIQGTLKCLYASIEFKVVSPKQLQYSLILLVPCFPDIGARKICQGYYSPKSIL